jgi:hypothetical protein
LPWSRSCATVEFFNIGGVMPLYSLEALSDGDVVDLLAYLGL